MALPLAEGHRWRHRLSSRLGGRRPSLPQISASTTNGQSTRGAARWTARPAQQSAEWARYESLVNAALAWANAALVCT
ncbi:MAG: hypothetical protein WCF33_04095 [Pseudonocardiaceae bacterium]